MIMLILIIQSTVIANYNIINISLRAKLYESIYKPVQARL